MVVVITTNVAGRFRGFLASCMLEIAPGVYTSVKMSAGVRERIWDVLVSWFRDGVGSSIIMTWNDTSVMDNQGLRMLGLPQKNIIEHEGLHLVRGALKK